MSDFADAVKHLDIVKARKATNADLESSQALIDPLKYISLTKSRVIKKINTVITLKAFSYNPYIVAYRGRLLFQYNLSLSKHFYIISSNQVNPIVQNGFITVKWRDGNTVHRYVLPDKFFTQKDAFSGPANQQHTWFPVYNNQLVGKNCVFEYWFVTQAPFSVTGITADYPMVISYLNNPETSSQTEIDITSDLPLEIPTLGFNLSMQWPQQQDDIVWLDN